MQSPSALSPVTSSVPARSIWLVSWPLMVGVLVYLYVFYAGSALLKDGDTYWHIASGQWVLEHGAVPASDPFSHTMAGAPWIAHEWLSEVLMTLAHHIGNWTGLIALTALMFSTAIALLTRALLRSFEPIYALLFAVFAVMMTAPHLLARPHILATPLMLLWTIELVRAADEKRTPKLWMLPLMTLWANMHGGFTLGLAMACAFALEAVLNARQAQVARTVAKSWGWFLLLAGVCSLFTPHGVQGIFYTWDVLFQLSYALEYVGEWQSPNFHGFQTLELWLLCGLAMFIHQGLRLPPIRLLLLLGFLHIALKHVRYVELLGLLTPLFLAAPLTSQWRLRQQGQQQLASVDLFFHRLSQTAGAGSAALAMALLFSLTVLISKIKPIELDESIAPGQAIAAVHAAGLHGPVLNEYGWGGYLIYAGIPPFIDGRSDMYRDEFLKTYVEALALKESTGLENLLAKYNIEWTLLTTSSPATTLLDHSPDWCRLYADKIAVVHVKTKIGGYVKPPTSHAVAVEKCSATGASQ